MEITIHLKDEGENGIAFTADLSEQPEPGTPMSTALLALVGIRSLLDTGLTSSLGSFTMSYIQAGGTPERMAGTLKSVLSEVAFPMLDRFCGEELANQQAVTPANTEEV